MAFKIIAFDSDGIGAIGSALALQRLDPDGVLVRQADMFAGNAMGAVTALGLAHGLPLDTIIDFFRHKSESLFRSRGEEGLYCADAMKREFAQLFGVAKLSELPLSGPKILVNVERAASFGDMIWDLTSVGNGRRDPFSEMLLADLAAGAACADGFFAPHDVEPVDQSSRGRFRTALLAENNPSASAMIYAEEHFHVDQADMTVLSIGTGTQHSFANDSDPAQAGRTSWGWPFSRFAQTIRRKAGLDTIDSTCRVSALAERYVRVEIPAHEGVGYDAWQHLPDLEIRVQKFAETAAFVKLKRAIHVNWSNEDSGFDALAQAVPFHSQVR